MNYDSLFAIHQGDQYAIILAIEANGAPIPVDNVELIEFAIAGLIKVYPTEVTRDSETGEFYFPISQQETFGMSGMQKYQVRIKYTTGTVVASPQQNIDVLNSISKKII